LFPIKISGKSRVKVIRLPKRTIKSKITTKKWAAKLNQCRCTMWSTCSPSCCPGKLVINVLERKAATHWDYFGEWQTKKKKSIGNKENSCDEDKNNRSDESVLFIERVA
jgi:hypothetical protein